MFAALLGVAGLAGCGPTLPAGATDQSREISSLYGVIFVVAVAIFLLVEGLIVYSVIRYRRKPGDTELPPQIHGNNVAEVTWTLIPLAFVVVLFGVSWQTLNKVDAVSDTPDLTIDVTAYQFDWQFTYPNAGVTVVGTPNAHAEMVIPVDETIRINLTSADVIHAFYVPAFNFKRDAVPGMVNRFEFTARDLGVFRGQCAELCGIYHSRMLFTVRVVSRAEFDAWLQSKASPSPVPSPSGPAGSAPAGEVLRITAKNIAFDQAQLTAPAGKPFSLVFDNQDAGVPHNVAIYTDASAGQSLFVGEIFAGPGERTYAVPALQPGSYFYRCDVHPIQMTGTIVAQ